MTTTTRFVVQQDVSRNDSPEPLWIDLAEFVQLIAAEAHARCEDGTIHAVRVIERTVTEQEVTR